MKRKPTCTEIAASFELWAEYFDPHGYATEEAFNSQSAEERLVALHDACPQECNCGWIETQPAPVPYGPWPISEKRGSPAKTIRLADEAFKFNSYVDGPRRRTVIFLQGCTRHCPGCLAPERWPFDGGDEWQIENAAMVIIHGGNPRVTISGGEPLAQADALVELLRRLHFADWGGIEPHIILYTGFVFEDAIAMSWDIPAIRHVFALVDIVVDGPYIESADDDHLQWRGSRNQRPIMVAETLNVADGTQAGNAWEGEPIVDTSWGCVTFAVTPSGDVIGAAGAMEGLLGGGDTIARCGENNRDDNPHDERHREPKHLALSPKVSARIKAMMVAQRERRGKAT